VRHLASTPLLALKRMRELPRLASLQVLKPGNRLSITPVSAAEWEAVIAALVDLGADPVIARLAPAAAAAHSAGAAR